MDLLFTFAREYRLTLAQKLPRTCIFPLVNVTEMCGGSKIDCRASQPPIFSWMKRWNSNYIILSFYTLHVSTKILSLPPRPIASTWGKTSIRLWNSNQGSSVSYMSSKDILSTWLCQGIYNANLWGIIELALHALLNPREYSSLSIEPPEIRGPTLGFDR